ncbi:MAG: VWA domain-containing protein, partial [Flavobacteriales bacterium]|nr:VWA domain-containing protein [Flavobacteriales bacterium]
MLAADFKPSRLEALKTVASDFVQGRSADRVALVTYASEAFTQTPLTTDKRVIVQAIQNLRQGLIGETTAIGMGLGTAINRLKDSEAKSKVIILLTDGVNNDGFVDPRTASDIAKKLGIKVYTIGIGTNGLADYPVAKDPRTGRIIYQKAPVEIDEALLRDIAQNTGGKYFRATDENKLKEIYKEIDSLEKSKVEDIKFYNYDEMFREWLLAALVLLLLEIVLRQTLYKGFL